MKIKSILVAVPAYVLLIGLLMFSSNTKGSLRNNPNGVSAEAGALSTSQNLTGKPERVHVPSVNINVEVGVGNYNQDNETWNVSENIANFATITDLPNTTGGNTVIYGHNSSNIFKHLDDINIDDKAVLYTDNGHVFEYRLAEIVELDPTDVSILEPTEHPRLTLLTCKGLLNEKRVALSFIFEKVR
ncbi:sortase [Patescibacteria group bacterium]